MAVIRHIGFLVHNNQYDSKRYFTARLREAFARKGITSFLLDTPHGELEPHHFQEICDEAPDLLISFSQIVPGPDGTFLCDSLEVPQLSILLDPVAYSLEITSSSYSIVSCVDRMDCDWLKQAGFDRVIFFPHAIEKELIADPGDDRPYEIVFIGSCYDHYRMRASWPQKYSKDVCTLMEEAAERLIGETSTSITEAVFTVCSEHGRNPQEVDLKAICFDVDYYVRGRDRYELITAFPGHEVHVFGEVQWATVEGAQGWSAGLKQHPNVVVHPPVPYQESLEILKKSKICLNSAPFFKDGTHERIFAGMACGCVVLSNRNHWIEEEFVEGEDLLLYDSEFKELVVPAIDALLQDDARRRALALRGQAKVHARHTWDQRAETLIQQLPALLQALPEAHS